jgi:hypothetical protein
MFRPLLISMFLTSTALADTWTVDDDGKADFDNIQAAIDAASNGDEIIVMPGTYTSMQDGHVVNMLGKAMTLRSSDPSDPDVVAATIIDGENTRRGIACHSGETSQTIISGFTITNGYATGFDYDGDGDIDWWEDDGGGMLNDNSSPTLTDCTFTDNTANWGGGMFNENYSNSTLTACTFENNTAARGGGGMLNVMSDPMLGGCTFTGNTAGFGGGGMFNSGSSTMLTNSTVCGNTPDQIWGGWIDGGGSCIAYSCEDNNGDGIPDKCTNPGGNTILVPEEYATIQDAINVAVHGDEIIIGPGTYTGGGNFVFNPMGKRLWIHSSDGPEVTIIDGEGVRRGIQCTGGESSETIFEGLTITGGVGRYGGGMYNSESNPTLTDCTFNSNAATYYGGGMYNYNSSPTLTNCSFENNTASESGGGMYNDYSSPTLIDTTVCGNTPDQINGDWTDNGGNTIADVCPDCPDINGDGLVNVNDLLAIIDQWGLANSPADVNQDGIVDVTDLLIVVGNWGECE